MNNIFLLTKNIKNYGLITFIKIVIYEIFYIFLFLEVKSLSYEQKSKDDYYKTKKKNIYNTPYIPTPYYFLSIFKKYLFKKKINNFLMVDLGCGYSRSQIYFSNKFDNYFLGFDYNKKIIGYLKRKKIKKAFFFNTDLRKTKNINFLINKISKFKNNKKLIIFFSDSFELRLLNKILLKISDKFTFYCFLVNIKNEKLITIKYNKLFFKKFNNNSRNINIFKINAQR